MKLSAMRDQLDARFDQLRAQVMDIALAPPSENPEDITELLLGTVVGDEPIEVQKFSLTLFSDPWGNLDFDKWKKEVHRIYEEKHPDFMGFALPVGYVDVETGHMRAEVVTIGIQRWNSKAMALTLNEEEEPQDWHVRAVYEPFHSLGSFLRQELIHHG